MAQLMPLPLTVSCFSKIQIGFSFLVLAHPGSPGQRAIKRGRVLMLHSNEHALTRLHTFTLKSGTFGVPGLVLLGSRTAWHNSGHPGKSGTGGNPTVGKHHQLSLVSHVLNGDSS